MMVHMPYVIIPPSELKELGDSSPLPEHLKQVYPILHMGQIPQDGENGQNMAFSYILKLFCDQTVGFFSSNSGSR